MTEQILAVQRMQDYIDAHLDEKISPAELAEAALYSPWYSYRLFAEYTGLTPAAYIRRLRLARAAMRLKTGNVRVCDRRCVRPRLRQRRQLHPSLRP